jgi:hypothetical protein
MSLEEAAVVLALLLAGLSSSPSRAFAATDYFGTYFATVGPHPRFTMQITQVGISASVTLTGRGLVFQGIGTVTDVALGVHTPLGYRLLSFFTAMPDGIFSRYQTRGVGSRDDLVITEQERDAQPLTCQGEKFVGPGALEN